MAKDEQVGCLRDDLLCVLKTIGAIVHGECWTGSNYEAMHQSGNREEIKSSNTVKST